MRTYCHIDLADQSVNKQQLNGEEIARAGRYFIARTLLDHGAATADPLSPQNPLIFSAGPLSLIHISEPTRLLRSRMPSSA